MRRVTLVIALAIVTAAMIALTVGSALAKDIQQNLGSYTDTIDGYQYDALPLPNPTGEGRAQFRATAKGDLFPEEDPGELDATLFYTGIPGPNVTTKIEHGTWILCSAFKADPRDPVTGALIKPECTPESEASGIALTGTVSKGTAEWDGDGKTAYVPTPFGCIPVYGGVAEVQANFTVTGGKVNGESVTEGTGKFTGTLDHRPFLLYECDDTLGEHPALLKGSLKLKF